MKVPRRMCRHSINTKIGVRRGPRNRAARKIALLERFSDELRTIHTSPTRERGDRLYVCAGLGQRPSLARFDVALFAPSPRILILAKMARPVTRAGSLRSHRPSEGASPWLWSPIWYRVSSGCLRRWD